MYIITGKPQHSLVSIIYAPALKKTDCVCLTPTQNITKCHMYMSTVVHADTQCYVTQS